MALTRLRSALIVIAGLVVVLLLLGRFGAEIGSAALVVLVCAAVVAYAVLRLGNRSKN